MAHKKGVGSSKNGRESASQRLGVKIWGGQKCIAIQAKTLVLVRTIRFMRWLTVWLTSTRDAATRA